MLKAFDLRCSSSGPQSRSVLPSVPLRSNGTWGVYRNPCLPVVGHKAWGQRKACGWPQGQQKGPGKQKEHEIRRPRFGVWEVADSPLRITLILFL